MRKTISWWVLLPVTGQLELRILEERKVHILRALFRILRLLNLSHDLLFPGLSILPWNLYENVSHRGSKMDLVRVLSGRIKCNISLIC
jgi:hypothetical protein